MSEEIQSAAALLRENAALRAALDQERAKIEGLNLAADQYSVSRDQWMLKAKAAEAAYNQAQADAAWWHATVANYVTSATITDREMLRETMAEALIGEHPGAVLLAELEAARKVVELVRWAVKNNYAPPPLYDALSAYDAARKEPQS